MHQPISLVASHNHQLIPISQIVFFLTCEFGQYEMLSDLINTEQLRNKPSFHMSLSNSDGGGETSVANCGLPTNDVFPYRNYSFLYFHNV